MVDFDLDLAIDDPDYPGLRIAGEFVALERYFELLQETVPYVRDQYALRFRRELERKHPEGPIAEIVERNKELSWVTNCLVPQFFLNPFLVSLSAALELAIFEIGDYVRKREQVRFRLTDLGRNATRDHLHLYLETVFREQVPFATAKYQLLDDLQILRNSVAHANASLRFERDERRLREMEAIVKKNIGVTIREDTIVVSETFLVEALRISSAYLTEMIQFVGNKYKSKK